MAVTDKQTTLVRNKLHDLTHAKQYELIKRFANKNLAEIQAYVESLLGNNPFINVSVQEHNGNMNGYAVYVTVDIDGVRKAADEMFPHVHKDKLKDKFTKLSDLREQIDDALFRAKLGDKTALLKTYDALIAEIRRV